MTTAEDPETLLKDIWQNLDDSMNALENGGYVDMVTLDKKVRIFCDTIKTCPAAEAKAYNEKIADIIAYLSNIVDKLNKRKDAVGEQIDNSNQRNRAQAAYGNASLLKNKQEA